MNKLGAVANKVLDVQTIKIDDIIARYGGIVTICGLGYAEYKGSRVPVFSFVEGKGMAFWGGCKKLRELASELENAYDGDLNAINDDFHHTGIRVQLCPIIKTGSGNPFRPVINLGMVDLTVDENVFDEETGEVVDSSDDDLSF